MLDLFFPIRQCFAIWHMMGWTGVTLHSRLFLVPLAFRGSGGSLSGCKMTQRRSQELGTTIQYLLNSVFCESNRPFYVDRRYVTG